MTLDFKYEKREYIDSRRKYLFMSKSITKTQVCVTFLLTILDPILFFQNGVTIYNLFLTSILLLSLFMLYFCYIHQPRTFYDKVPKFHEDYHLEFSEDNIIFHTNEINAELHWNNYNSLWENKKYFYLIQNKDMYTLIPKRVFPNEEQCKYFKELFRKNNPAAHYRLFY